jgi:hypothetical protein
MASVRGHSQHVHANADGSVDVYFTVPAGQEDNWIQLVPGKGWFTILALRSARTVARQDLTAKRDRTRPLTAAFMPQR